MWAWGQVPGKLCHLPTPSWWCSGFLDILIKILTPAFNSWEELLGIFMEIALTLPTWVVLIVYSYFSCDQIPGKHLPEGGDRFCVHAGDAHIHGKQKCALLLSHILEDQEAEHRGIPIFKGLPLYCFCSVKGPCLQGDAAYYLIHSGNLKMCLVCQAWWCNTFN